MWTYIKSVSSGIWAILLPMILQLVTAEGKRLVEITKNAVKIATTLDGKTGEEKFRYAAQLIASDLKREGITFGTSLINATIEAVYQSIKKPGV